MMVVAESLPDAAWNWWPPGDSNSIGWLVWHIAEVEDNWVRDKLHDLPKRYPFSASVRDTERDGCPSKAELLTYFHDDRAITRQRLFATSESEFDRMIDDEHFGGAVGNR